MSRVPLDQILDLPTAAVALAQAQKAKLERRWLALERNPDEGEPWEDVRRSLLDE